MYFTSTVILSLLGLFVQYGKCATNCSLDELGVEVPVSACEDQVCEGVTIDQLKAIKNKEILATKWNSARNVLVSKCELTYDFEVEDSDEPTSIQVRLNITINYGENCDQITYYEILFQSEAEKDDGKFKYFIAQDGKHDGQDITWKMCFPYLEGSDFIYRRCRVSPKPEEGEAFATIYVYEEAGGPTGNPAIIQKADALGVDWANKTVDCL